MNLPIDICLKIEKSPDKEDVLLLLARLENDGVTITNDVYAAIVATRVHETRGHRIDLAVTPLLMFGGSVLFVAAQVGKVVRAASRERRTSLVNFGLLSLMRPTTAPSATTS